MKQFIVLCAVLPIMLIFMAQFTLDQINNTKISLATDIVYAAKEEAKQNGGFDVDKLKNELSEKLGLEISDIKITADSKGTVYRINKDGSRGIINYEVKIPIKQVMAGKGFFGIKDDSRYGYVISSCCPSEYLP